MPGRSLALVLLLMSLLVAWLLARPGGTVALYLGEPAILILLGFASVVWTLPSWRSGSGRPKHSSRSFPAVRAHSVLMLSIAFYAFGQVVRAVQQIALGSSTRYPNWADALFLSSGACLLCAVLLLAERPQTLASRSLACAALL